MLPELPEAAAVALSENSLPVPESKMLAPARQYTVVPAGKDDFTVMVKLKTRVPLKGAVVTALLSMSASETRGCSGLAAGRGVRACSWAIRLAETNKQRQRVSVWNNVRFMEAP